MTLLDQLNPPQKTAAAHLRGPLLILAGAGSGKTRVITYRIAWLILHHKVFPEQILALTFTNKAAAEMRERVDQLLSDAGRSADARAVSISTFHSFCARLLRRHAADLGLSSRFSIYDADDQLKLIKSVMDDAQMPRERGEAQRLRQAINQFKNQGLTPTQAHEQAFNSYDEADAEFYERYQAALLAANSVDFGDLILGVLRLFRQNTRLADSYSRRFEFQMVDEFQDTNPAQYELLKHLTRCHQNLCVVGDDDQAIYRWRGATIKNILGFERDFEDAEVVKLEQNYRSSSLILEVANDVIRHNPRRRDKTLWTEREGGEPVSCFTATNDREEASFVATQIRELTRLGADWSDFAVFYRTNAQSRQLEEQLQNQGVPYQVIGGISFYERAEIKDILGYLKVALNPDNRVDFLRVVNTPSRGVGKRTLERLERAAKVPGVGSLYRAMRLAAGMTDGAAIGDTFIEPAPQGPDDEAALDEIKSLRGRTKNGLIDICEVLVELRDQLAGPILDQGETLYQIAHFLIDRLNYMDYLVSDDPERADDRQQNVLELLDALREFEDFYDERGEKEREQAASEEGGDMPAAQILRAFLERSALVHGTDQMDERGAATLMTVHGAKGLEFDTVFLVGMEDELFPSLRDISDAEELYEERRLAYVAITRARQKLYITNARTRRIYGQFRQTEPSRFLLDINPEHLKIDPRSTSQDINYGRRSPHRRVRNRGYDEFRQFSAQSYFGDNVDQDLWEFDQSAPMIKGEVSRAVDKTLKDQAPEQDFDTSFSQLPPWEEAGADTWPQDRPQETAQPNDLSGKTVSHSRFGIGKIITATGSGDKAVLSINFPGAGEKKVIRKFVKILG